MEYFCVVVSTIVEEITFGEIVHTTIVSDVLSQEVKGGQEDYIKREDVWIVAVMGYIEPMQTRSRNE